ncbi:MAG: MBL fold metallo-hydrolase [Candidatus Bathyarchaeota archaeon]|nr:MBL fold metallo-hydrolase [Candidatus Bathyarchaeota archaeon]
MALTVKYSKGVIVEYGGFGVAFDPTSDSRDYPIFVTHAHADHAAAFKYPDVVKYSTEPTYRLLESMRWAKLQNWRPVSVGEKVRVGDMEVRAHNAGHVLGSVQYEVATPEGTLLYTGDFSMGNSYTMEAARVVGCDLLVVETTFGAPMFRFPKRRDVALDMVRWATMEAIPSGRIPTFKTDSIGNAQEVISMFNRMTKLPVVTAKSATRVSDVYRDHGYSLDYVDADSPEGRDLIESGRCAIVAPKGSKLRWENLETALASGWAVLWKRRGRAFPLSDHADFRELLGFIRRCHPKRVLTFHGGALTRGFADYVRKRLGIDAKALTGREETLMGTVSRGETRMRACYEQLLRTIRIPGFEYTSPWLVREMAKRGFTRGETEAALRYLVERRVLMDTQMGVKLA